MPDTKITVRNNGPLRLESDDITTSSCEAAELPAAKVKA